MLCMGKKLAEHEEENSLDYYEVYLWEYFCHFVIWSAATESVLYKHLYTVGVEIQLYRSESFQKIICKGWSNWNIYVSFLMELHLLFETAKPLFQVTGKTFIVLFLCMFQNFPKKTLRNKS